MESFSLLNNLPEVMLEHSAGIHPVMWLHVNTVTLRKNKSNLNYWTWKSGRSWIEQTLRETFLTEPEWGGRHTVKAFKCHQEPVTLETAEPEKVIYPCDFLATTVFGDISILIENKCLYYIYIVSQVMTQGGWK